MKKNDSEINNNNDDNDNNNINKTDTKITINKNIINN